MFEHKWSAQTNSPDNAMRDVVGVIGLLLFLSIVPAGAQSAGLKTYRDAKHGVSFAYPANWTSNKDELVFYGADALLTSPDENDVEPIANVGWIFRTGDKSQPTAGGINFEYAIFPDKTADACRRRVLQFKGGSSGTDVEPNKVTIHGVRFDHIQTGNAGLGHSWTYDVFTTIQGGTCYGFEEGDNETHIDSYARGKGDNVAAAALPKVMQSVRIGSASAKVIQ